MESEDTKTRNPHKGGRPPLADHERRDVPVKVMLRMDEKIAFRDKAAANGQTVSDWLRDLGNGHSPRPPVTPIDMQLLAELNRIGVNLNQTTRHFNAGHPTRASLDVTLSQLTAVLEQIMRRL